MGVIVRVHYWVDGDELWSAEAAHFEGSFWRVANTEKLVKRFASHKEAEEELERFRKNHTFTKV